MTYSRLANPRETRAVLEDFGLATKHRLGQNFLVNDEVIGRIVNLAELDGNDVVLEVGPGIGPNKACGHKGGIRRQGSKRG